MNCVDAKRHLDLFLDGELDVETNLKVLEHLNLCTGCAKVFEGERWLGGEVRRRLCDEKAPAALRGRICGALDREGSGRRWVRLASAAASVLVAATVGYLLLVGPVSSASAQVSAGWLAEAAARHHDEIRATVPPNGVCVCPKCSDQPVEELQSFYGKSGACCCPYCLHAHKDYVIRSGGVWRDCVGEVCAAWTTQVAPNRAVLSQASVPASAVRFEGGEVVEIQGHSMRRFQVGPRVILMGLCGPRVCVMVVDSSCEADRLAAK